MCAWNVGSSEKLMERLCAFQCKLELDSVNNNYNIIIMLKTYNTSFLWSKGKGVTIYALNIKRKKSLNEHSN